MPIKVIQVVEKLRQLAPEDLAEEWDNVGLQIGSMNDSVSRVLLALDITPAVLQEAIEHKVNMIVTHHPFLFQPLKQIVKDTPKGIDVYTLIQNNISVYTMHTNLDSALGGTNDVLAEKIGLTDIDVLIPKKYDCSANAKYGLGRIGNIREITVEHLAQQLKTVLNTPNVVVAGNLQQTVKKVALCTGSGMSFLKDVIGKADIYITGDMKFHEAQEAKANGMTVIDIGHYASENIVLPSIKAYIDPFGEKHNIDFIVSQINEDPFIIL